MSDPAQVELPPLRDEVLELVLIERYGLGHVGAPPGYWFSIVCVASGAELGKLVLRVDQQASVIEYTGHLAYEIAPEHRGRGHAARACRVLAPLVRVHLEVAWIMVSPDNPGSMRTAERLGAEYIDTRELPASSDIRALGISRVRRYRWSP